MRYLVQYKKEFIITIGVFVSVAVILAWVVVDIYRGGFSYEHMMAIISIIFEMLGWYFNMPTSVENHDHTGQMRLEKKKDNLPENYWDDIDEGEPEDPFEEGGDTDGEC